jgi:ATP-dependent DNA ligase
MAPVVERRKKIQFAKGNVYEGKPFGAARYVEDKLDGLRGGIIFDGDSASAVTLTGLPIPNAQHVIDEMAASGQFDDMMIDGEFKGRDWNESQSIVKTQKPHPDADNLKFYAFDCMPTEQWESKALTLPLAKRKANLKARLNLSILPHVVYVNHKLIHSSEQVIPARNEAVARGLEGIMLKDPDAPYAFKKNNYWLKCKPINEADFFITGAFVGRGKNANMLGALQIMNEKLGVECEVGTGFDDLTRKQLWADYLNGRLMGRIVQVEYQEVTEDNALRFPAFMRMRDDKDTL